MFHQLFLGFASLIIFALRSPSPTPAPSPTPEVVQEEAPAVSPTPEISPEPSPEPQAEPSPEPSPVMFTVSRVIDGDTLEVTLNGKKSTVRLIGIDTPETVDPRRPVQCFGQEASSHLKELLNGKAVELLADTTQGDKDKYARLLRYISLEGKDVGEQMIRDGYAQEYTYSSKYEKQTAYKEAQKAAQESSAGLWNAEKCPAPSPKPTPTPSPRPTPSPKPVVVSSPKPAPIVQPVAPKPTTQTGGYTCDCSKTCDELSYSEAQYQLNTCGCKKRDGDHDGIACDR